MKILMITILLATAAIQAALGIPLESFEVTNEISPDETLKATKRFKLAQFAYENLRQTVWPEEVFTKMSQYVQALQEWSGQDEALKESTIYAEFQETLDNCVILLRGLKKDPGNCEKQRDLKRNHDQIRQLFQSSDNEKFQYEWTTKYMDFVLQTRPIMRESYEKLYVKLATAVDAFIAGLSEFEEYREADILQWDEKFTKETDFIRKEMLVIEFMGLFPDERQILETKCKVRYSNGL